MTVINVTHWNVDDKNQVSGTRAKHWLIHPTTKERYLFKIPTENTGEAWAEKVASEIGKSMGLSMMDVEIAVKKSTVGILAKNFRETSEEFFEGGDLFFTVAEDFDRYSLKYYDFFTIIKVLSDFNLEKDFIIIPVFDAFIGNQDRHCDNWGIIASKNRYRLSPIYDNGASLGFQLEGQRIEKMFEDFNMFKAFSNRSFSMIGLPGKKKPRYLQLLSVIKQYYPSELKEAINLLKVINEDLVSGILEQIPEEVMSEIYKHWVKRLLLYRKQWLLNWYGGGV